MSIEIRHMHDDLREELVRKFYDELYVKAFPVTEEREQLHEIIGRLKAERDSETQGRLLNGRKTFVSVIGYGLDDPETGTIVGYVISEYYPHLKNNKSSGLLSYINVAEEFRSYPEKFGRMLFDMSRDTVERAAQEQGREFVAFYSELKNPSKLDWQSEQQKPEAVRKDVMDPSVRLKIFKKMGDGDVVPIDYVAPLLEGASKKPDGMMLMSYPLKSGQHPFAAADDIKDFLQALYVACGKPGADPWQDPDMIKMCTQIDLEKEARSTAKAAPSAKRQGNFPKL